MNASWVNPSCARCEGTTGVRLAVRHRGSGWIATEHRNVDQTPRETVRPDGMVFRWPAPFLDPVPKPGVLTASDIMINPPTEPLHPDGTCATPHLLGRSFVVMAHLVAADVAKSTTAGTVTWSELLLVQVLGTVAQKGPQAIYDGLNNVSDLAELWRNDLERRIQ